MFLENSWSLCMLERRFNSPQIAALLGVSRETVERRLREYNLNLSNTYHRSLN